MLKRSRAVFDEGSVEMIGFQQQDAEFCRALRAAIEGGRESCPIGVTTEPGTNKPVRVQRRPDSYY